MPRLLESISALNQHQPDRVEVRPSVPFARIHPHSPTLEHLFDQVRGRRDLQPRHRGGYDLPIEDLIVEAGTYEAAYAELQERTPRWMVDAIGQAADRPVGEYP